ncbi:MAG: hypothetical protein ABS81_04175 [Pseudonocardia sp. SCN 72-86]|nr:MAG: hypothetical protein ABS81_04175 [Pseudonocardia sp. SCN 72-86]
MAQALVEQAKNDVFYAAQPVHGSAATVAEKLAKIANDGQINALLMTFPDYIDGLRRMDADVKPHMESLGITFTTTSSAAV